MPSPYPQRALTVLLLFGTLSAAMALLSSSLIFQLPSGRAAPGAAPGAARGALPQPVAAALVPVSAVLAALCLVLNMSCFLLCLLHGYFSTELCRGQPGTERADWFLLDSRSVRHAALGLFCCGVCLYLTALALFMLLLFELEAGIASACILTSGILVLLISLLHALLRASQISQNSRSEPPQALYENDSAQPGDSGDMDTKIAAPARPRPEIHREFSFPLFPERKSQQGSEIHREFSFPLSPERKSQQGSEIHREFSFPLFPERKSQQGSEIHREFSFPLFPERKSQQGSEIHREFSFPLFPERKSQPGSASSSNLSSAPRSRQFPRECRDISRAHRTLAEDSGLLQEQGNPWNGAARKGTGKDSTLV